jgi:uncharacterized membrane protein (UPF0127 family)
MPWLVRDGRVVASLEIADSPSARRAGLLRRDGIEGALLLQPARSVHTMRMRFVIDVAHLDRELRVIRVARMAPWRLGTWRLKARAVLECEAGSLRSWGVNVGDLLEIRE